MSNTNIINLSCKSCGANIKIPSDVDFFNCAYCGAALMVQRGEGYVAVKLAEKVSQSIQESGSQTQSTIREGTHVTQLELKKLQISQPISTLQMQLNSIQSEIRTLEREKSNKRIKRQLKELRTQETSMISQIRSLQTPILESVTAASIARMSEKQIINPPKDYAGKDWRTTFVLCTLFGFLGIHRFYIGRLRSGLIYLFTLGLFGIGWVVDFILLAVGSLYDQYKFPLRNRRTHLGKSWLVSGAAYFVTLLIVLITASDATTAILIALLVGGIAFAIHYFVFKKTNIEPKIST
jgi:TM2 domain-containing membrane protein YozV